MRRAASEQGKRQSAKRFAIVLLGATGSIAAVATASGCGPNNITILDCPDSGAQDGGDGGSGGSGGASSLCK